MFVALQRLYHPHAVLIIENFLKSSILINNKPKYWLIYLNLIFGGKVFAAVEVEEKGKPEIYPEREKANKRIK
jgi:hypothetical protein